MQGTLTDSLDKTAKLEMDPTINKKTSREI